MTDKELARLNRNDLLQLLIDQVREADGLREEIAQLQERLKERTFQIENAGTLAEAATKVTGLLEAAQEAADLYRENAQRQCDEMIAEAQRQAEEIRQNAMHEGNMEAQRILELARFRSGPENEPAPEEESPEDQTPERHKRKRSLFGGKTDA